MCYRMNINFMPVQIKRFVEDDNIRLVLFGDTHGFCDDIRVQTGILKQIRPDFYLHELIENRKYVSEILLKKALLHGKSEMFSIVSNFGELFPIFDLCLRYRVPLIGMDLRNMGRENMGVIFKDKLTKNEAIKENQLQEKREHHQATVINKYVIKAKAFVFAVTGAYHLRKRSHLLKNIKAKKYIVICPAFKGKAVFGPKNKMRQKDIHYDLKVCSNF